MNIYISNLSYGIEDSDLNGIFAEYGEVSSAKVIRDNYTGKSKGFGFVEMPDNAAAQKAIEELNDAEYDGKQITVQEARPREERPRQPRSNFSGNRDGNRGTRSTYGDRPQKRSW
jgi:RNA recognition motif-containing protein